MKFGWLHISDIHLEPGEDYGRDLALRKLISAVKRECSIGRELDAIFITGDVVSGGNHAAYRHATTFFDNLLNATNLSRERLYSAEVLGEWNAATARDDDDAIDSLVAITGLHPRWVRRYLNGAAGRTLLRNLFAHRWPDDE